MITTQAGQVRAPHGGVPLGHPGLRGPRHRRGADAGRLQVQPRAAAKRRFSDDQISSEIRISGKAAYWPQWDLGCRLLVCRPSSRLRLVRPTHKPAHFPVRRFPGKLGHPRFPPGAGGPARPRGLHHSRRGPAPRHGAALSWNRQLRKNVNIKDVVSPYFQTSSFSVLFGTFRYFSVLVCTFWYFSCGRS